MALKFNTFSSLQAARAAVTRAGSGRLSEVKPKPQMSKSGPEATSKAPPVSARYRSDRARTSRKKRSGTISSPAL